MPEGEVVNLKTRGRWRPRGYTPLPNPPSIGVVTVDPSCNRPTVPWVYIIDNLVGQEKEVGIFRLDLTTLFHSDTTRWALHDEFKEAAKPKPEKGVNEGVFSSADFF
jgi:hypothetical protein